MNIEEDSSECYKQAKMAALDLLSRREHTSLEIQRKLSRRSNLIGVDFEQLSCELIKDGWLSHERFSDSFIRSKRLKAQGPIKIAYQLKQRGLIDAEFSHLLDSYEDWDEMALALLQRKVEHWPDELNEQAKLKRFLSQRGFSFQTINQAVFQFKNLTNE